MNLQIFIALVIAIPVILFPVAVIWYLNIGGIFTALKEARAKKTVHVSAKVETKN